MKNIFIDIFFHIVLHCDNIESIYQLCKAYPRLHSLILYYQNQIFGKLLLCHYDELILSYFSEYVGSLSDKYFAIYLFNIQSIIESNVEFTYKYVSNSIRHFEMFNKLHIFRNGINEKQYINKIYKYILAQKEPFYNRQCLNKKLFLKLQNLFFSIDCDFNIDIFVKSILAHDKKNFKLMFNKNKTIIHQTYKDMPLLFYIKFSLVELKKITHISKRLDFFVDSMINVLKQNGANSIWFYQNTYWTINGYYAYLMHQISI